VSQGRVEHRTVRAYEDTGSNVDIAVGSMRNTGLMLHAAIAIPIWALVDSALLTTLMTHGLLLGILVLLYAPSREASCSRQGLSEAETIGKGEAQGASRQEGT
jgi:hypothetical protein